MVPSSRPPSLCGVGPRTTHRPAVHPPTLHCTRPACLVVCRRPLRQMDVQHPACGNRHSQHPLAALSASADQTRPPSAGRRQALHCVRGFFSFSPITIRLVNPRFVASAHARCARQDGSQKRCALKRKSGTSRCEIRCEWQKHARVNMRWCGCVRTMRTAGGCALKGPTTRDCPPARVCNSNATTALSVHSQIFFSG